MNLMELEMRTKELTDWRVQFEKRPMTLLGLAFGSALVVGVLAGRGRYKQTPLNRNLQNITPSPRYGQIQETLDMVKGALIGVAATRFKSFVGELIPGFHDEIRASEERRRTQA